MSMSKRQSSRRVMVLFAALGVLVAQQAPSTRSAGDAQDAELDCAVDIVATLVGGDRVEGAFRQPFWWADEPATGSLRHETVGGSVLDGVSIDPPAPPLTWPASMSCALNGAATVLLEGRGTWNGRPNYEVVVVVQDRDNPNSTHPVGSMDRYVLRVWSPGELGSPVSETLLATRTYAPSRWTDEGRSYPRGARIAVPPAIPVIVGHPDRGWTWLRLVEYSTGTPIHCKYRGNGLAAYEFVACQRPVGLEFETDFTISVGTELDVASVELHIQQGSNRHPTWGDAQTIVQLDLTATPFIEGAGTLVYHVDQVLATGDARVWGRVVPW
jgi:hypothetical protein